MINFMLDVIIGICVILTFVLPPLHFWYERLMAPNLRGLLRLDMELLILRIDVLRKSSVYREDIAFDLVDSSIKVAIHNISKFNLSSIKKMRRLMKNDYALMDDIARKNDIISRAKDPELLEIVTLLDKYVVKAFTVNCGGMMFWLSPFLLVNYFNSNILKPWIERIRVSVRSEMLVMGMRIM